MSGTVAQYYQSLETTFQRPFFKYGFMGLILFGIFVFLGISISSFMDANDEVDKKKKNYDRNLAIISLILLIIFLIVFFYLYKFFKLMEFTYGRHRTWLSQKFFKIGDERTKNIIHYGVISTLILLSLISLGFSISDFLKESDEDDYEKKKKYKDSAIAALLFGFILLFVSLFMNDFFRKASIPSFGENVDKISSRIFRAASQAVSYVNNVL